MTPADELAGWGGEPSRWGWGAPGLRKAVSALSRLGTQLEP